MTDSVLAEPVDEEIARDRGRLYQQARTWRRPVGQHAEQQAAAETRQSLDAIDAHGRHRRAAAAPVLPAIVDVTVGFELLAVLFQLPASGRHGVSAAIVRTMRRRNG